MTAPRYAAAASGALLGSRCDVCGVVVAPPRLAHCDRPMAVVELTALGRVESFADVHVAPADLDPPYRISTIRLTEGPRLVARLEGEARYMLDPRGEAVALRIGEVGRDRAPALVARLDSGDVAGDGT